MTAKDRNPCRPTPSRAWLIHLLIQERAYRIAHQRVARACGVTVYHSDADRDQARREIETYVLCKNITMREA